MKFTTETKVFLGIVIVTLLIIFAASFSMTKPIPTFSRAEMIPDGTATKGNPQAEIYLVEFSDFQCPACKSAQPFVDAITEKYKDKMIFAYRHFPLAQHAFSTNAALAAEAAAKQGKFWEMYSLLFANQEKFNDNLWKDLANQLKLNPDQFDADMKNADLKTKIDNDQSAGEKFAVTATPTFFLNGKKLDLNTFTDLEKAVSDLIK